MSNTDQLQRWLFEDINARCVHVQLESVLREALGKDEPGKGAAESSESGKDGRKEDRKRKDAHPELIERLLSHALLLVSLMSSGIKFSGRISLQLQSSGPLRLLMADCTDDGGLRCIARLNEDHALPQTDAELWQSLTDDGILTLTLEPGNQAERWQGIVPLEGNGLAEAIENYFIRSEQLATRVRVAVAGQKASALMIQRMPAPSGRPDPSIDADGWNRLSHLIGTLSDDELGQLSGEDLVTRLFHQEDRRQFPERALRFYCPCSRDRVAEVLLSLGQDEVESMAEEGETVNVQCEFCARHYDFDPIQLLELLSKPATTQSRTVH